MFKWEILFHLLYLPDIAPSDYHLFRSMAWLSSFHSYEDAKIWSDSWIASKDVSFFRHGIQVLPQKWEKVMASWLNNIFSDMFFTFFK